MKQLLILLIPILLAGCSGGNEKVEKALEATYSIYQTAIANKNGRKAVEFLDKQSVDYYGLMLERVNTWDKEQLKKLDIIDQATILLLRRRVDPNLMLSFTGKDFLAYAIDNDFLGNGQQASNFVFDQVQKVRRNRASAFIRNKKDNSYTNFEFYKEEDVWKLNISQLLLDSKQKTLATYQANRYNPDEVLNTMIRAALGTDGIPEELWIPLAAKARG